MVITIVVLLILAGVAISISVDEDGLFRKAGQAKNDWNANVANEESTIQNILEMAENIGSVPSSEIWYKVDGTTLYLNNTQKDEGYIQTDGVYQGVDFANMTMEFAEWAGSMNMETGQPIPSPITKAVIEEPIYPTSTAGWFGFCMSLTEIENINNTKTENVTNMNCMFICTGLIELDLNRWNTANVTDMFGMFSQCANLSNLNISNWNTENVTNMTNMFEHSTSLTELDLNTWETKNVTNMMQMFNGCDGLTSLKISEWNTGNVTNMSKMFYMCESLTDLDLSAWNTANVDNMSSMFEYCGSLASLNISTWNTGNVTDMSSMFDACASLTSLDLGEWNTASVTNMSEMFCGCDILTELNTNKWNMANVTDINSMFFSCDKLNTTITLSVDSTKLTNYTNCFLGAALNGEAGVVVNYTASAESIIDDIIATKYISSNVTKGTKVELPTT